MTTVASNSFRSIGPPNRLVTVGARQSTTLAWRATRAGGRAAIPPLGVLPAHLRKESAFL